MQFHKKASFLLLLYILLVLVTTILSGWLVILIKSSVSVITSDPVLAGEVSSIICLIFVSLLSFFIEFASVSTLTNLSKKLISIYHTRFLESLTLDALKVNSFVSPDRCRLSISSEIYDILRFSIIPSFYIIVTFFQLLGVIAASIIIDPILASIIILIVVVISFLFSRLIFFKAKNYSRSAFSSLSALDKQSREFSDNLIQISMYKQENYFIQSLVQQSGSLFDSFLRSNFLTRLPRITVEQSIPLIIGVFLLFGYYLSSIGRGDILVGLVPVLTSILFATQRLVVVAQRLSASFTNLISQSHYLEKSLNQFFLFTSGTDRDSLFKYSSSFQRLLYDIVAFVRICLSEKHFPVSAIPSPSNKLPKSTLLSINDLSADRIASTKLKPLSLQASIGELWVVRGPSGSGKSSFLEFLIGSCSEFKGKLSYSLDDSHHILQSISFSPQYPFLYDADVSTNIHLSPNEQVDRIDLYMSAYLAGCFTWPNDYASIPPISFEECEALISDFLVRRVGRNGSKLSGGEVKRVSLARAIFSNRSILIADEPTSGLDDRFERHVATSLLELSKTKLVIITSHSSVFEDLGCRFLDFS